MDKKIPIYFDNVIIASPLELISESKPNLGRLKVGVFTKYGNRNGSYITDEVAEMLIQSAIKGDTPVIGFFDPETKSWASHTGPTLASAYGYVENFEGWKPLTDTDGVERDYAIFTVVLFTKYFEEANLIVGQNQSMELAIDSIEGSWVTIEENEYFVYTKAAIQGLCVIGSHEPCFSVSSFFSLKDETYETQYQKFSSLLAEAKEQVEEVEKGGEPPMDDFENKETVAVPEIENEETSLEEPIVKEPSEFENLQKQFNELQSKYEEAQTSIEQFQEEIKTLRAENEKLQTSVNDYELRMTAIEDQRKQSLVEKYEKILNEEEEISSIKESIKDYSYETLESKLAILFANQQLKETEGTTKVPLPEPQESQFALLMKKYRKK